MLPRNGFYKNHFKHIPFVQGLLLMHIYFTEGIGRIESLLS